MLSTATVMLQHPSGDWWALQFCSHQACWHRCSLVLGHCSGSTTSLHGGLSHCTPAPCLTRSLLAFQARTSRGCNALCKLDKLLLAELLHLLPLLNVAAGPELLLLLLLLKG